MRLDLKMKCTPNNAGAHMKGNNKRKQAKTSKNRQFAIMNIRKLISLTDGNLYVDLERQKVQE